LRDFQAVREPRAKQVAFVINEDLRLVFETAERRGVNDPIAIALEFGARARRLFLEPAPARFSGMRGIGGEMRLECERGRCCAARYAGLFVAQRLLRVFVALIVALNVTLNVALNVALKVVLSSG
jgi:hypothetical protein